MRRFVMLACLATIPPSVPLPAFAEIVTRDLTAEFSYAIRDRLADRDGFWFATYELSGDAVPAEATEGPLALSCIGSAWGFGAALMGETAICRLAQGADLLFGRVRAVEGTAGETFVDLELHGGRGVFAGYAGRARVGRAMDLAGAPAAGRGAMTLRLELFHALNEEE